MTGTATQQRRVQRVYGLVAGIYDFRVGKFLRWRKPAVEALRPQPGDTVLDLACGTGLNFPHLIQRIGPSGRLVGVDFTLPMLKRARRRIARQRWDNVTLLEGDATHLLGSVARVNPHAEVKLDGLIKICKSHFLG